MVGGQESAELSSVVALATDATDSIYGSCCLGGCQRHVIQGTCRCSVIARIIACVIPRVIGNNQSVEGVGLRRWIVLHRKGN
jgi:hypothetical protein